MAQNVRSATRTDSPVQMLYITTSNRDEALSIAKTVVSERLAACANIINRVSSIYWWEDTVQEDTESALILKTHREKVVKLTSRIKDLHSYDCPCVVALNIGNGNPDFLNWVVSETTQHADIKN